MPQRISVLLLAAAALTAIDFAAASQSPLAEPSYAQYYPPPSYGYPPSSRPPCQAVTPGPFQGPQEGPPEAPCFASSCATDNGASRSRRAAARSG